MIRRIAHARDSFHANGRDAPHPAFGHPLLCGGEGTPDLILQLQLRVM
jgi:hypothetical protein